MTPRTLVYYDWLDDIRPAIIGHMGIGVDQFYAWRRLSDPDSTNPMTHTKIFHNYWTILFELWGENIVIGRHVPIYFADPANEIEWSRLHLEASKYGEWATVLVTGVREMVRENNFGNKETVIRFSAWF